VTSKKQTTGETEHGVAGLLMAQKKRVSYDVLENGEDVLISGAVSDIETGIR